eukprot:3866444-Prymnesium_polylepis.1
MPDRGSVGRAAPHRAPRRRRAAQVRGACPPAPRSASSGWSSNHGTTPCSPGCGQSLRESECASLACPATLTWARAARTNNSCLLLVSCDRRPPFRAISSLVTRNS